MPKFLVDTDAGTCSPYTDPSVPVTPPKKTSRFGWNAPKLEDYQPRTLANVALTGRKWIDLAGGWKTIPEDELALDARGWPTKMPAGKRPASILTWDQGAKSWPDGEYVISSTTNGSPIYKLVTQTGKELTRQAGRFTWNPSVDGGLLIELVQTGLMSLSIYSAKDADAFAEPFLQAARGAGCIRWMDAQKTNNSTVSSGLQPYSVRSFAADPAGISMQMVADASDLLAADAWVCIPHLATDAYIKNMAIELKHSMPPEHKVYVEFSNELWNFQFSQGRSFGATYAIAAPKYNARAAVAVNLFKQAYGANCVRVIAAQSANLGTSSDALKAAQVNGGCDALAVAPYWGHSIKSDADFTQANVTAVVAKAVQEMRDNLQMARQYGVQLLGYEGGMHCVGISEANAYGALMGQAMTTYLQAWESLDAGVLCLYNLAEAGSAQQGFWGHLRSWRDANPKYDAAKGFMP